MTLDATLDAKAAPAGEAGAPARWVLPQAGRLHYIDGLRAVAIVAVVAFHTRIPGFRGGFVGVDIFFVISGFLITNQIAGQVLAGRFSATDFYARRVTRILPPLLLVTLVVLAAGTMFPLLPRELREIDQSAAATAAMISNYYYAIGTEYFTIVSEIQPLLHTWSLGVEEQYYLLAPALIIAVVAVAARRKHSPIRALFAFGLATIAATYLTAVVLSYSDHRLAFYSLMTRAWQFCGGGMLAIAALGGALPSRQMRAAAGPLGLAIVAAALALFDAHMRYPGYTALVPTFGALLLIASGLGAEPLPLTRVLASPPAVAIGVLSYSWYLWHWPLVSFARSLDLAQAIPWRDTAASAAALVLSVPTYVLVEQPMKALRHRHLTPRSAIWIIAIGLGASALVAALALAALRSPALQQSLSPQELGAPSVPVAACRDDPDLPAFPGVGPCIVGPAGPPHVLVWGDSHAGVLSPLAGWAAEQEGRAAIVLSSSACPPLLGLDIEFHTQPYCYDTNQAVARWVMGTPPRTLAGVVLAARWANYDGDDFAEVQAGEPLALTWHEGGRSERAFTDVLRAGLAATLSSLRGRRVLILGMVPEFRHAAADCALRAKLYAGSRASCAMPRTSVDRRNRAAIAVLQGLAAQDPDAMLIDPTDVFCDQTTCSPFGRDGVYYSDGNHLAPLGAEQLYHRFEREFRWVFGAG